MRGTWKAALAIGLAALAAACASGGGMPAVEVVGSGARALAGAWAGEYSSGATGRSGSIQFDLSAGGDTAHGSVLMIPRGAGMPLRRAPSEAAQAESAPRTPQDLTIRFVRVAEGRVSGVLDPYTDPDCGCTLSTTFEGEVRGDRIEGTFTSRGSRMHGPVTGTWSARRLP